MKNKGITMIALIITIIILLILAGVSIALLTGENGIVKKAELAKQKSEEAELEENATLGDYENIIDNYMNNSRNTVSAYKILFDNSDGATEGTLSESINNFDILIAIYRTAMGEGIIESKIFTPKYSILEFNFSDGVGGIFGYFSFDNQNFTTKISYSNSDIWTPRYKINQVIGIKF